MATISGEVSRRTLLGITSSAVFQKMGMTQTIPVPKPNVVVIVADDLGWGDLGCYNSELPTPEIDRLAESGIRFTDFHTSASTCTPSRVGLLTGRYACRAKVPGLLDPILPDSDAGLPADEITIAHSLKRGGYKTACVGKWHLGHKRPEFFPTNRGGFDHFFGILRVNDVNPLFLYSETEKIEDVTFSRNLLMPRLSQEAVRFIRENKDNPFFLYFAPTAPHFPLLPSPDFVGKTEFGPYGDSVAELSFHVGRVIDAIRENGIEERTLVVFLSDNGPADQGSSGGFRGRKFETFEGGHRVPCIARWPGVIPAGRTCRGLTSALDLMPTITDICGVQPPNWEMDGENIRAILLEGSEQVDRKKMLLHFNGVVAECGRIQDYKMRRWIWGFLIDPPWLFSMRGKLPDESCDIAPNRPATAADMLGQMDTLVSSL